MSMSLLQNNVSDGMARLYQEMRKAMVEITTQVAMMNYATASGDFHHLPSHRDLEL